MDTTLITMDPAKAKAAFLDYREAVKGRHRIEDEILMRGYKHLAKGKQCLDLIASMKKAGVDELSRPRLAIARADWEWCWFRGATFSSREYTTHNQTRQRVLLPANTFPKEALVTLIRAKVPLVPAGLKPSGNIGNYHVLWEPDWEMEPPTDPILLRHLGKNVYAVLAVWDLTELERALLR